MGSPCILYVIVMRGCSSCPLGSAFYKERLKVLNAKRVVVKYVCMVSVCACVRMYVCVYTYVMYTYCLHRRKLMLSSRRLIRLAVRESFPRLLILLSVMLMWT